MPAIEVEEVRFRYSSKGPEVLHGVSLRIEQGEFVALIGQNGAGKTTLAKHFNGLLKPTSGRVLAMGINTRTASVATLARTVGYVYQNPDHQIFAQKVHTEVAFGPKNLGLAAAEVETRVTEALELVELSDHSEDYAFSLGRGQRQKLAVASVLAMRPPSLVVDEPTTGLDLQGSRSILDLLSRWNSEGRTIVVITHDMTIVAERVPRTVVVGGGRIIADGPTRDVLSDAEVLAKAFLRPPQITRVAQRLAEFGVSPTALTVAELRNEVKGLLRKETAYAGRL
ncbi:MAG: energy-coupling factor ABC transporter ATP-binding protein [Candidatus Limnocylindria bacterium]